MRILRILKGDQMLKELIDRAESRLLAMEESGFDDSPDYVDLQGVLYVLRNKAGITDSIQSGSDHPLTSAEVVQLLFLIDAEY